MQALGVNDLEEAEDGIEALEVLQSKTPDLVIVDWKMDGMDGVEFVKEIRSLKGPNRFVPIIMVTGYTEDRLRATENNAGVSGFLGKPISPKSVLGRIVDVLEMIDVGQGDRQGLAVPPGARDLSGEAVEYRFAPQ